MNTNDESVPPRRVEGGGFPPAGAPLEAVRVAWEWLCAGPHPVTVDGRGIAGLPDRLIPPTMIAGLTPPAMAESIIFLILLGVKVDPALLFGAAMATFAGGLVGAPLVVRARAWIVQMIVAGRVKVDGAYVQFLSNRGKLEENMKRFPDAFTEA